MTTKSNWKKYGNHIINVVLTCFVLFLLVKKVPGWIANVDAEGQDVAPFVVKGENAEDVPLPKAGKKQIVVFWATWCGPCEVELSRFNTAVKDGEIKADEVLAVSLGEDPKLVYEEVKKRGYAFTTLVDPETASLKSLRVDGTPQTYHIDEKGKIQYASMGLSVLSVWRAKNFLSGT